MGSPASPVIADIVMEQLLQKCFENTDKKPRLLTKYVDDLFGIVKEHQVKDILNRLNSFHHKIKFTVEEEDNGRLPYLDTLVIRRGNKIKIDWYQKPTASGRMINYFSCQPKSVILNTAGNLIRRVMAISDNYFHKDNIRKLTNILKMNAFPEKVIKNLINRHKRNQTEKQNEEQPKIYKSLLYIPQLSERVARSEIYNKNKFKIASTSGNNLGKLFTNTKSQIDKMEESNLIYKIECKGDKNVECGKIYIGTTKNKLKTRIAGHKSDIKYKDNVSVQKTALAAHCAKSGHVPNFDNIKIIQRENKQNKRYTLEMLHIINTPQEKRINYKTDTENCAQSYRHIINKAKLCK